METIINRSLYFNKCFCCSKNFNITQLIELSSNSVVIGEETVAFLDIILDVCLVEVEGSKTSFICDECKNQLVYFHMFKRDIKKYSSFSEHIRNLKILAKIEETLKDCDDDFELLVSLKSDTISISKENKSSVKEEIVEEIFETEFLDEPPEELEMVTEAEEMTPEAEEMTPEVEEMGQEAEEVTEEYIYDSMDSDHNDEIIEDEEEPTLKQEDSIEIESSTHFLDEVESLPRPKRQRSQYKYPINTNDKLTTEEKEWINQQVRDCMVEVDGKFIYKCPLCDILLKISGTLKKHLRDSHILKTTDEQKLIEQRKAFRDEINQSKMTVDTVDGPEIIFKCQRCEENRIFRSESGLKVHLRFSHIRGGFIDTNFVAQCKIVVDSDFGAKDAWQCPECMRILKSRDGLRNHMKLQHPEIVTENRCNNSPLRLNAKSRSVSDQLQNILEKKRRGVKNDSASCNDCGIQFVNGTSRKEKTCRIHQDCHKILKVLSQFYQLPKCDATKTMFSNNDDLSRYLILDQPNEELFPCDGMTAKISQSFKEPTGTSVDEDSWKCGHCGARYTTEFECNAHVMILHSNKLICPIDHMTFEGNRGTSQFTIHMRNKHAELFPDLVISCSYCGMENFSSHFEKLDHMRTCSEKKFICDHCGRKYFLKTELLRHLKIAMGEIKYVCNFCSKSCVSTMDLKLHESSHTNQKHYPCSFPDCHKAFKTPAARSSHMETHSNISYACSYCSATFRQRALLQRHIKKGICNQSNKETQKQAEKQEIVFMEMFEEV